MRSKMKCPNCKKEMEPTEFDIGYNIIIDSMHCKNCGFNVTEEDKLNKALSELRKNLSKEVKIIKVGEGLGIRIPNGIVKNYNLKKGSTISLLAEENGLKIVCKTP